MWRYDDAPTDLVRSAEAQGQRADKRHNACPTARHHPRHRCRASAPLADADAAGPAQWEERE
eukprot:CAMPEP_0170240000 /NCGR_PEP_ID=MMETSP0116_2-20130129/19757_1 /TAXON_ID=400756 /ORGANISM="Durinskia baltica, Strain CSIRO CS-38" /LENGTH=61 /DNA_ID=CAMNT_0010490817 /DNA_START=342 /DNA_END=524 /DNA_ORIENTATION=+